MVEKTNSLPLPADVAARAEAIQSAVRQTVRVLHADSPRASFQEYAKEFSADGARFSGENLPERGKAFLAGFAVDLTLPLHLILDGSASMNYGSAGCSKFHYAQSLAACLAYLMLNQGGKVQLHLFNDKPAYPSYTVERMENFSGVVENLSHGTASGSTAIGRSVEELSEKLEPGSTVVLLSDFFEEKETWAEAVKRLRFQGNGVLLCQVMDPDEINFPFEGDLNIEGMEGEAEMTLTASDVKALYLGEVENFLNRLRTLAAESGSHYLLADSSRPLAEVLESASHFRRQVRFA